MISSATASRQPDHSDEVVPMISIVIVNWNGVRYIDRCLKSVLSNNEAPYEVVVVDNASTDGRRDLVELASRYDRRIRLIKMRVNVGFSVGNNVGVSASKGEFVTLLNPDTEVELGWLGPLLDLARSEENLIVQSKLMM